MTKWTEDDISDQTGRTILITGANSGIGFEATRALAERGAHVVMGCRNASKAQVQTMVAELLSLQANPESDAADALACAICHSGASRLQALGVRARRGRRRGRRSGSALSWKPAQ